MLERNVFQSFPSWQPQTASEYHFFFFKQKRFRLIIVKLPKKKKKFSWRAASWLGAITAGKLWVELRDTSFVKKACSEIVHQLYVKGYLIHNDDDSDNEQE